MQSEHDLPALKSYHHISATEDFTKIDDAFFKWLLKNIENFSIENYILLSITIKNEILTE